MTAVCCTYPLDVLRARIAFQLHGEHMYSGVIGTVRTISQQEGKIALFRGMIPTLLGMVPYGGKGLIKKSTSRAFLISRKRSYFAIFLKVFG